jgi:hypothetical protein
MAGQTCSRKPELGEPSEVRYAREARAARLSSRRSGRAGFGILGRGMSGP